MPDYTSYLLMFVLELIIEWFSHLKCSFIFVFWFCVRILMDELFLFAELMHSSQNFSLEWSSSSFLLKLWPCMALLLALYCLLELASLEQTKMSYVTEDWFFFCLFLFYLLCYFGKENIFLAISQVDRGWAFACRVVENYYLLIQQFDAVLFIESRVEFLDQINALKL